MKLQQERVREKRNYNVRKRISFFPIIIAFTFFSLSILGSTPVSADGGMIPYHEFSVYEPGQKAIISWDGADEIMILSVDVYSEQSTKALHMVPFPSLPEVGLGDVSAFEKIEEIVNRYNWRYDGHWGDKEGIGMSAPNNQSVEIVFHEKVGPHDITAVHVNSPVEFTDWVNNFLEGKGISNKKLPNELDTVVSHYTDQDIRYFVFDVIDLEPNQRSVDPIIYRFDSDYLFFPLEISSIIEGNTEITLALITPHDLPISSIPLTELGFYRRYDGVISNEDLIGVDENITEMFEDYACLSLYDGYFSLDELKNDVMVQRLSNVNWMFTAEDELQNYEVADINDDGKMEIILTTKEKLNVFNAESGEVLQETVLIGVKDLQYSIVKLQAIDVNLDGILDIIATTYNSEIYAFNGIDGTELWNKTIDDYNHNEYFSLIDDGSCKIIVFGGEEVYALNGKDGTELWYWKIKDVDKDRIRNIYGGDLINDGTIELVVSYNSGRLVVLSSKDGSVLWKIDFEHNIINIEIGNFANNKGMELLCHARKGLYLFDGKTGTELWNTMKLGYDWDNIRSLDIIDYDEDGKFEIMVYSKPIVYLLNGEDGSVIQQLDLATVNEDYDYFDDIDIDDLDSDGKCELIGQTYNKLCALSWENGTELWEFSTGDHITYYEVADIDNDNYGEVVMVTGNKVYTIEHYTKPSEKGDMNSNEYLIIVGSIVLPLIFVAIILIFVIRTIERKSRY